LEAMAEGREVAIDAVKAVTVPGRPIAADAEDVVIPVVKPELERTLRPGVVLLEGLEAAVIAAEAPDWMNEPVVEEAVAAVAEPVVRAAPSPAANNELNTSLAALSNLAGGGEEGGGITTTQSIRVSVDVLEGLMTLVSEMVLTRNQL